MSQSFEPAAAQTNANANDLRIDGDRLVSRVEQTIGLFRMKRWDLNIDDPVSSITRVHVFNVPEAVFEGAEAGGRRRHSYLGR